MDHQSHAVIVRGTSPIIKPSQTYHEATEGFSAYLILWKPPTKPKEKPNA